MGAGEYRGVLGGDGGWRWGVIWTDFFMQPLESHGAAWSREVESNARQMILNGRRSSLRQYELESYAAIGRMVCRGLEAGTRSYVDLGHDPLARYTRVIEVTTPAYLELSE